MGVTVICLVGVGTTSGRAVELIPLWVIGAGCTNKLHRLKNNKKMNKNEETESLMIWNVSELVEAARREVVVGEVQQQQLNSLLLRHLLYMLECN
jgi:hypothetical protein